MTQFLAILAEVHGVFKNCTIIFMTFVVTEKKKKNGNFKIKKKRTKKLVLFPFLVIIHIILKRQKKEVEPRMHAT